MKDFLTDVLLSLLIVVIQTTLVRFVAIADITPDLPLLWVIVIAIRRGQIAGTVAGFSIGLLLDLLSGSDSMLGLSALTKTASGFVAGYFYNENKTLQTLGGYALILITLLVSTLHNLLYFFVFLQGTDSGLSGVLFRYGIPTTLYTAAAALLPMFVWGRRTALHV
jgi:rod shape-determining protein MreD